MTGAEPDYRARLGRALDTISQLRARLEELTDRDGPGHEPVAVTGVGCRFPGGADSPEAFWRLLRDGTDAITRFPAERGDAGAVFDPDPDAPGKAYCVDGGFIDGVDAFDASLFGVSPTEAVAMDPQQRLLLEVTWEALERAGIAPDSVRSTATGVFIGASTTDYVRLRQELTSPEDVDPYQLMGEPAFLAGRVAYHFGLRGPAHVVDTACSSSLLATHLAVRSLRSGECDMALAGGVNLMLTPYGFVLVSKARALAPDGRCKTFDASADGYGRGEGVGVVVLKRLSDALAAGDPVLAVIHGSAVNHDGRSSGISVPSGTAQQEVVRAALADARLDPGRIGYVEAHGTGTVLGDPIELRALHAVLGGDRPGGRPVWVGSVKTNVGHLEAAAGVAGLVKLALSLRHREIPPHLHFTRPNPNVDWDELSLAVPVKPVPWPEEEPYAGLSSFGVSGTNVHLVLGPPPAAPRGGRPAGQPAEEQGGTRHEVLVLSARTGAALRGLAARYARLPQELAGTPLREVCRGAARGRASLPHRLAVVAGSVEEAAERLGRYAEGRAAPGLAAGRATSRRRARVAFLFSGQGSQYPGMGRELYETEPVFRAAVDRCEEALRDAWDVPLTRLLYGDGSGAELDRTRYTQPALFAVEYALAELWRSWGVRPGAVLGHSVGEYVAACVAGALPVEDALALVDARARLMEELAAPGAMLAVRAGEDEARAALAAAGAGERVAVAAVNSDQDVVLSGPPEDIGRLAGRLTGDGVRVTRLRVARAFHSPMVEPALDGLRRAAASARFAAPQVPLISNLTGRQVTPAELADPGYWCQHARQPVRFRDGMRTLDDLGFATFLEAGPGRALLGIGAACLPGAERAWLASLRRGVPATEQIRTALGELHVLGVEVDWPAVYPGEGAGPPLPVYAFDRERYWFTATRDPAAAAAAGPGNGAGAADGGEAAGGEEPALLRRLRAAEPAERAVLVADYLRDVLAAALWTPAEEIDTDADLLKLGVDSLLVMQVVTACKSDLGVVFSPRELFENATVDEWSALVTDRAEREHGLPGAGTRGGPAAVRDWSDPAQLLPEARLDPAIRPAAALDGGWRDPEHVLLTGATGFVGAFLLEELLRSTRARVHCLVRARDAAAGLARLRANTERYMRWPEEHADRITVVPGDLAQPRLGLGEEEFGALAHRVDAVYHNGASVNFVQTFRQLRDANVGGTTEILRLACTGPLTPVHHVSTFAVWGVPEDLTSTFAEDDDLSRAGRLPNGYLQTKWVTENVVRAARERGVPVNVYRLGQIMGDSRGGACVTSSFTCAVIKGCIQFGAAPELDMLVEMTPADYVSRALVHISLTDDGAFGKTFHLLNPERLHFSDLIGYIRRSGWAVDRLPGEEWVERFRARLGTGPANALDPLIDTISEIVRTGQDSMTYLTDRLSAALAGSGITCPPLDDALLDTYFRWMVSTGFLDRPDARREGT